MCNPAACDRVQLTLHSVQGLGAEATWTQCAEDLQLSDSEEDAPPSSLRIYGAGLLRRTDSTPAPKQVRLSSKDTPATHCDPSRLLRAKPYCVATPPHALVTVHAEADSLAHSHALVTVHAEGDQLSSCENTRVVRGCGAKRTDTGAQERRSASVRLR